MITTTKKRSTSFWLIPVLLVGCLVFTVRNFVELGRQQQEKEGEGGNVRLVEEGVPPQTIIRLSKQQTSVDGSSAATSLMTSTSNTTTTTATRSRSKRRSSRRREQEKDTSESTTKSTTKTTSSPDTATAPPNASSANSKHLLLQKVQAAKAQLQRHLQELYGDYYQDIFEPHGKSIGRQFFKSPSQLPGATSTTPTSSSTSSNKGWERMVRKLRLVLLQHSTNSFPNATSTTTFTWMTAGNGPASGAGNLFRETFTYVLEQAVQPMFQAVGIHFIAKNYAIRFQSSGDEVALCSHALYGDSPDIIFWDFDMTDEQDFWKLAMFAHRITLANHHHHNNNHRRPALWANQRTKQHTSLLRALEANGMTVLGRDMVVQTQQYMACPDSAALISSLAAQNDATSIDLIQQQLPPLLQFIRCGKEMEEGGPHDWGGTHDNKKLCRHFKFNMTVCPDRPFKYIWHPGYKTEALKGYTIALTLTELLLDAIGSLTTTSGSIDNPKNKLRDHLQAELERLKQADQDDHNQLLASLSPSAIDSKGGIPGLGKWYAQENKHQIHRHVDIASLFAAPALCRTAWLPSVSRRLLWSSNAKPTTTDTTTNNSTSKIITNPYKESYEMGMLFNKWRKFETSNNKLLKSNDGSHGYSYPEPDRADLMVVVTDKSDYYDCPDNNSDNGMMLFPSHQDAFMVTSAQGWRSMTLPNKAEQEYFQRSFNPLHAKGWIFLCLMICDNSKCPSNDMHDRLYKKPYRKEENPAAMLRHFGIVELNVNGVPVSDYERLIQTRYSHLDNCLALKRNISIASMDTSSQSTANKNDPYVWKSSDDGTYTLRIRIVGASQWSFIRISSVIIM